MDTRILLICDQQSSHVEPGAKGTFYPSEAIHQRKKLGVYGS